MLFSSDSIRGARSSHRIKPCGDKVRENERREGPKTALEKRRRTWVGRNGSVALRWPEIAGLSFGRQQLVQPRDRGHQVTGSQCPRRAPLRAGAKSGASRDIARSLTLATFLTGHRHCSHLFVITNSGGERGATFTRRCLAEPAGADGQRDKSTGHRTVPPGGGAEPAAIPGAPAAADTGRALNSVPEAAI